MKALRDHYLVNSDREDLIKGAHEWAREYRLSVLSALRAIIYWVVYDNTDEANKCLECLGLEGSTEHGRSMEYLNTGDTYALTLCREGDQFFWSSWGDWMEEVERESESL